METDDREQPKRARSEADPIPEPVSLAHGSGEWVASYELSGH